MITVNSFESSIARAHVREAFRTRQNIRPRLGAPNSAGRFQSDAGALLNALLLAQDKFQAWPPQGQFLAVDPFDFFRCQYGSRLRARRASSFAIICASYSRRGCAR